MQIIIYADIIFLLNFLVDLVVLILTGLLLKEKMIWVKIGMGAMFGAGMLLFFMLSPLRGDSGWTTVFFVGTSMGAVVIAYGKKGILRKWFLSTTIMVLLGSIMNYLRYLTGIKVLRFLEWWVLFLLGVIILCLGGYRLILRMAPMSYVYPIQIRHGKQFVMEQAYLDTGNLLWDPLFHKPVVLLSETVVKRCLSEEENKIIEEYKKKGRLDYESLLREKVLRIDGFHEITYESVGNPSGKLLVVLLDEIKVSGSERILHRQPVAIGNPALFDGKCYQGLLHKDCV